MSLKKLELRPSNSERVLNCSLSLILPRDHNPSLQEKLNAGTEAHKRLAKGEFLPEEEKCKAFYEHVLEMCDEVFKEVPLSTQFENNTFAGTPDLFGYSSKNKTLYVIDYKTGDYVVEAKENSQLLSYAVLILVQYPHWKIENYCLSILQTKKDLTSSFYPSPETVVRHSARIEAALNITYNQGNFYSIKGFWCRTCPSRRYCPLHRDITVLKNYCDMDTDHLLYAKHKRHTELLKREKELLTARGLSKAFDYDLVAQKRFKLKTEAPKELLEVRKLMTPAEAKKVLTDLQFESCFEEEETTKLIIGDEK